MTLQMDMSLTETMAHTGGAQNTSNNFMILPSEQNLLLLTDRDTSEDGDKRGLH